MPRPRSASIQVLRHWLAALLALLYVGSAMAALGDDSDAPGAEVLKSGASLRMTPSAAYSVVEQQTALGVSIREYVNAAGTVFAVSWRGPFKPDMRALLGSYFGSYQAAPRAAPAHRSRTNSRVALPNVVVHSGGRPRAFQGYAYVPGLTPAGVDPNTLP